MDRRIDVDFEGIVPSEQELKRLLRREGQTVFFGLFNLCFFDPSKANCYTLDTPVNERSGPIAAFCDPAGCENSAVTPDQLPLWKEQLDEVERHLKDRKLPRLQRESLRGTRDRIRRVMGGAA